MTNLELVQKDGWALKHIEDQTEEVCLAAVSQSPGAIEFVEKKLFL